jgi:hypothetical protein
MLIRYCCLVLLLSPLVSSQEPQGLVSFVGKLDHVQASAEFSEKNPAAEWQPRSLYKPPAGQRSLLGRFHSGDTAQLTLKNLPPHRALLIRLDIVILCHWDGVWKTYGPDEWRASLRNGPTLLSTTFSNYQGAQQHFPDEVGSATHPYQSGSITAGNYEFVKEMGDLGKGWEKLDCTYHLWLAVEHKDPSATLQFSGKFHDAPDGNQLVGESWAIASSQVWAIAPTVHPQPEALASALASLTDTTQIPSTEMIATLVISGENGLQAMEKHLRAMRAAHLLPPYSPNLADPEKHPLGGILKNLSAPDLKTRQAASKELILHVPQHRKKLLALLENHPEPETRIRIQHAIAACGEEQHELTGEEIIAARLKHVLRLIKGPNAAKWLAHLR